MTDFDASSDAAAALRLENQALRACLEEAEETLHTIQSGDLDALVLSIPNGEQTYNLHGSERVYRAIVETMHEGALTLTPDGIILFSNQRFAELLRMKLEQIIGAPLHHRFIDPNDQATWNSLLRIPLTVSIGITALNAADVCVDAALSRADAAMYQAKEQGRNRVVVNESL